MTDITFIDAPTGYVPGTTPVPAGATPITAAFLNAVQARLTAIEANDATDAELAAAIAGVNATLGTKVNVSTYNAGIAALNTALAAKADLVNGRVPVAQLGSGTPDGTKFLKDDGSFAALPSAGSSVPADGSIGTVKLTDDGVTEPKLAPAVRTKLNAVASGGGSTYPNGTAATVVQRPLVIDARDYGVLADNSTDDTAAIQAAINAAPTPALYGFTGNDQPATIVQLPRGRMKVLASLKLKANMVLRGHGPASTYLMATIPLNADGKTDPTIKLATGAEVQCELRDFGIIANSVTTDGIHLIQAGGGSILGDTHHVVDNVIVVGGSSCFASNGSTELRVSNFTGQRQVHNAAYRYDGIFWLGGTDHMIETLTLAQPDSTATVKQAIRNQTSNTRFVNCKVFGGGGGGAFQGGANNRNQLVGCEVQDYNGEAFDAADVMVGCIADSCKGPSLAVRGHSTTVRGFLSVNRGAGAYTPQFALDLPNGSGSDIDMRIVGPHDNAFRQGTQNGSGNRLRFNLEGGWQTQGAYAATYTPDPHRGTVNQLAALTGAVSIANPAPSVNQSLHVGMELTFLIPQDTTGGRTVTFGSAYKTAGAVPTTAATVTTISFAYDGTDWRETGRSTAAASAVAVTAPNAPTIGTASSASPTSASVPFTPAATGDPATSYTATSTPGGITATGASSPITVPGLTTGTAYTFKVKANNAAGSSADSAASNAVTPSGAAPSVPTSGLAGWYRADDITVADGAQIASWPDASGNNRPLVQSTAGSRPTFRTTGGTLPSTAKPTVDFAASKFLSIANAGVAARPFTGIIVARAPATATSRVAFALEGTAGPFASTDGNWTLFGGAATPANGTNVVQTNAYSIVLGEFTTDGVSSQVRVDGKGTVGNAGTAGPSGTKLRVGIDGDDTSGPFNGQIAEVLLYGRSLTSAEILQVENYLRTKYGTPAAP